MRGHRYYMLIASLPALPARFDVARLPITLERLGATAQGTLFIDDIKENCDGARELGMTAIHFRTTEETIEQIETALAGD